MSFHTDVFSWRVVLSEHRLIMASFYNDVVVFKEHCLITVSFDKNIVLLVCRL